MAHSIPFAQANNILGAPKGMTQEECNSLELYRDGRYCISKWQFTDEEIEELKRNGGKMYLWVLGSNMQPVIVSALDPWRTLDENKKA